MKLLRLSLFLPVLLMGQTTTVKLSWQDTRNPAATTYNVYRAPGLCSGSPVFAKIANGVTAKTYDDANVAVGNFCYATTASLNGLESAQSNTVQVAVPPAPPTSLNAIIQ
jgi:hypothetical protein